MKNLDGTCAVASLSVSADDAVSAALQNIWMLADFFLNMDKNEVVLRPATMITASAMLRGWADEIKNALQIEGV